MRTTLYSRLKPEIKKQLKENAGKYPATSKSVIKVLKSRTFYSDMTICEVTDFTLHANIYERTDRDWFNGKDLFVTEEGVA